MKPNNILLIISKLVPYKNYNQVTCAFELHYIYYPRNKLSCRIKMGNQEGE